jgi:uncharacterized protein
VLRAVIDSNVWISALLSRGKPRELVNYFERGSFTVIYPKWLIYELRKTSSKPRLSARIHPDDLHNLVMLIERIGVLIEPPQIPVVSRDPKDDVFLACAATSKSDFLVTGDDDLLCLHEHHSTQIIPPGALPRYLERRVMRILKTYRFRQCVLVSLACSDAIRYGIRS